MPDDHDPSADATGPTDTSTDAPAPSVDATTDAPAPTVDVTTDATSIGAPMGLLGTPGDGRVFLSWTALAGAMRYAVKRADVAGGPYAVVGQTTGTAFLDPTVANETTYHYVVSALIGSGEGVDSAEIAVTPTSVPGAPTALVAASADRQVSLSWTAGPRAASVRVRRATQSGGPYTDLGTTVTPPFIDTGLTDGRDYFYVVSSINPVGESAASAEAHAMPIAAPADLVAVASDRRVALFWTPCEGATAYDVAVAARADGPFATVARSVVARLVDDGLANGVARYYRVVAVNPVAISAPAAVTATPGADAMPLPPAERADANRVGLNLWFNTDWDAAAAFADMFKQSRPWQDARDWHLPVGGTDALGWPTADASTVLFSGPPAELNGTYRLVFEGQATVSVMWCPGTVEHAVYDAATNTTTADVTFRATATGSVGLVFSNTRRTATSAPNSGFARARLYRPGYPADGSVVFTAPFLAALRAARVLRPMEWTHGSSNVVVRWADRVTPNHATQGGLAAPPHTAADGAMYTSDLGVALEHQIQLCNQLLVDCWINVPPVADDDFVRNMALALRFGTDGARPYTAPQARPVYPPLDPSLRLYVEFGNENWNSGPGFLSYHLLHALAEHLPAAHPLLTPATDSIYTLVWRYPAWRTAGISETFRAVFGDAAMMTRVRPVLMTQIGNANNTLGAALSWLEPYLRALPVPRRVNEVIYGAGGSAYYGVNAATSAVPDRFFATTNYPETASIRAFAIDSVWAANVGVRHVAYEGGPGLAYTAGDNRALNADARMQSLVEATHAAWSSVGGDLLVYYNLRGPSEWEFTPDIHVATTPKLRALEHLQTLPRAPVTLGAALPGTLIVRNFASTNIRSGYGYDINVDGLPCAAGLIPDNFTAYPGHASAPYSSMLHISAASTGDARIAVWINGVRQGEITLPGSVGTWHLRDSTAVPVTVPAGVVVVRLEMLAGNLLLRSITL